MSTKAVSAVRQSLGSSLISKLSLSEMPVTERQVGIRLQNHPGASVKTRAGYRSMTA
jgi:hypothetical protein